MGLDGISVNQLRITPEKNSAETASIAKFTLANEVKVVDGLAEGQKVDPDRQNEKQKKQLQKSFVSQDEEENIEDESNVDVIKYDLTRNDKYCLRLDEDENSISIIEKASNKIVQKIDAQELSLFVNYLSNSQGAMVNRRF